MRVRRLGRIAALKLAGNRAAFSMKKKIMAAVKLSASRMAGLSPSYRSGGRVYDRARLIQ